MSNEIVKGMDSRLAIVIPAYKSRFLKATLDSIAKQSCKDFVVYIGDDNSPQNLEAIVGRYRNEFPLVYHRFEENMGRNDLPGHWERCIALSRNEPLIWLFSDDDLMPADGVERILQAAAVHGDTRVFFRFPLSLVDAEGHLFRSNPPFDADCISGYHFLLDKLGGKISSAACEYVFSRDVYTEAGGFVKFPLAWCSDDASWARFADLAGGIVSLYGQPVCWRNAENENISNSIVYNKEKAKATALFVDWIARYYPDRRDDAVLHCALKSYIKTILVCSLRSVFDVADLWGMCRAVWQISPAVASGLFAKYLFRALRRKGK